MKSISHRLLLSCIVSLIAVLGLSEFLGLRTAFSAATSEPNEDRVRIIALPTNDIVFNPADQTLYASIPGTAPGIGNSIGRIDPYTGGIFGHTLIGSDPAKLALSSDGSVLYTYLAGAFSVGKYDVASQTSAGKFPVGQDSFYGLFTASDLAVSPDDPNVVAVARQKQGVSPPQHGVAVFNSGVQLPLTGPGHSNGSDNLAFGGNGQTLFGTGSYSSLTTMSVTASGVTVVNTANFGSGSLKYAGGRIFTSSGHIIDAATQTLLGTIPNVATSAFVPDVAVGRVYYLTQDDYNSANWTLRAFDVNTFTQVGSMPIANVSGTATSLVRWGTNGLAFRTSASQLFLVQSSLIPTDDPLPPFPPVVPTPTPTPYAVPSVRQIAVTSNDIEYSASRSKLYVSVPGSVGVGMGNSITEIDPVSGSIGTSIPIGSEPGRLAISDDGGSLYVGINGSASAKRLDLTSGVADTPFYLGNTSNGPNTAYDLDVMPGNPNIVAVSVYGAGTSVYENGVRRSQTGTAGYFVEFLDQNILYAADGPLTKYSLSASGLSSLGTFPSASYGEIQTANGKIFSSNGRVVDGSGTSVAGTFSGLGYDNALALDPEKNRAFFISGNGGFSIRAYELDTMRFVGAVPLTGVNTIPKKLFRWGANGLAFRTDNGSVYLIQSDIIDASVPVPSPSPTPTITPTPTPAQAATFVRSVDLSANDLIYNAGTGSLIASVAGAAGSPTGNTISYVDPLTGTIQRSVFIGSDPNKLAQSDDGTTLYTGLGGASAIRRFDIASGTPGLQFPTNYYFSHPADIAVMPGSPGTIAVAGDIEGLAVFDNGVLRGQPVDGGAYAINSIAYSNDPNILYGYDNHSSGFELVRFSTASGGPVGTLLASNLIGGYSTHIRHHNGLLYTSSGRVYDPEAKTLVGTFSGGGGRSFAIDPANGRVFFLNGSVITAFDMATFVKLGSIQLPQLGSFSSSLVRWGDNGLALRTEVSPGSGLSRVVIVQSHLVAPSTTVPTGIQLVLPAMSITEGSLSANMIVSRNGDLAQTSTVDYATSDGTASAGSDYTATSGTLTFQPGESSKVIAVPITNDSIFETNENFTVTLSNATGTNVELLSPGTITVTITNNDSRPRVSAYAAVVVEPPPGGTAFAMVPIQMSNASVETVSVNFTTVNGTAMAGADFIQANGTLLFAPGETQKQIPIQILADTPLEGAETFTVNISGAVNGTVLTSQSLVTIENFRSNAQFDFDGDGKADPAVFRPDSEGIWYVNGSQAGVTATAWGIATDKVVPADYDGDGKTDVAVYRDGTWWVVNSNGGGITQTEWGIPSDVPVPADYDGDGKADLAIYRGGVWWILHSNGGGFTQTEWGIPTDVPVPADYDGDGKADLAVFRSGTWWVFNWNGGGITQTDWGIATDKPVPADYDGDGKADLAVYRNGTWWVLNSNGGGITQTEWGIATDIPVPADYDGDSKTDIAVYRDGDWWVMKSNGGGITQTNWGIATDKPVPADYDGDGKADLSVYRDGDWWTMKSNGGGITQTNWGIPTDIPIPMRSEP